MTSEVGKYSAQEICVQIQTTDPEFRCSNWQYLQNWKLLGKFIKKFIHSIWIYPGRESLVFWVLQLCILILSLYAILRINIMGVYNSKYECFGEEFKRVEINGATLRSVWLEILRCSRVENLEFMGHNTILYTGTSVIYILSIPLLAYLNRHYKIDLSAIVCTLAIWTAFLV